MLLLQRWYLLAEKLMYVKVICSEFWPSAIPPYHMLLGCCRINNTIVLNGFCNQLYSAQAYNSHHSHPSCYNTVSEKVVISSTIDPLEHVKHDFVIVVVQKPNAGILIIFLEWNCTPPDASEKTARRKSIEHTLSSRGKP